MVIRARSSSCAQPWRWSPGPRSQCGSRARGSPSVSSSGPRASGSCGVASFPSETATGLVGAWPVVLLAFAVPWGARTRPERRLAAIVLLGSVGVAVTQYDIGSGFNWGGRFLAPALPLIAVLVAGALPPVSWTRLRGDALLGGVLLVVLVLALSSWSVDGHVRSNYAAILAGADQVESGVPIVTSAIHVPRMDWGSYPDRQWLAVPDGPDGPEELRRLLVAAGIHEVAFYVTRPRTAEAVAGHTLEFPSVESGLVASPVAAQIDPP